MTQSDQGHSARFSDVADIEDSDLFPEVAALHRITERLHPPGYAFLFAASLYITAVFDGYCAHRSHRLCHIDDPLGIFMKMLDPHFDA